MLQVTPELHENWDLVFSVYPFALSIQHRALHLLGGPQLWLNDWIHYLKLEKGKWIIPQKGTVHNEKEASFSIISQCNYL